MKLGKFVEDSRIHPTLKPIESAKPCGQVAIADDVRGTGINAGCKRLHLPADVRGTGIKGD
jgi:hypothetical protein